MVEVIRCIGRHTLSQVVDVFRGNNTVGVRKHGHDALPAHGLGRAVVKTNGEAERLVRRMVVQVGAAGRVGADRAWWVGLETGWVGGCSRMRAIGGDG